MLVVLITRIIIIILVDCYVCQQTLINTGESRKIIENCALVVSKENIIIIDHFFLNKIIIDTLNKINIFPLKFEFLLF